jgi:hypothetical protein
MLASWTASGRQKLHAVRGLFNRGHKSPGLRPTSREPVSAPRDVATESWSLKLNGTQQLAQ